jgi:large subunit ribosomal protein L10
VNRTQKEQVVDSLKGLFTSANIVLISHYSGLNVDSMTALRNSAREVDVNVKVSKNTLTRMAIKDTPYEGLLDSLTGPTLLIYANDVVSAAKVLVSFAKDNEALKFQGGAIDGKVLDESELKVISYLPSLEEIRAKIIGSIQTPATNLASLIQAPAGQVARVINAYASK